MENLFGMLFYMFLILGTFGLIFIILAIVLHLLTGGSVKEMALIAAVTYCIRKLIK